MNTPISAFSSIMPITSRPPLVFERGAGSYLFDSAGQRYLDWVLEDPAGQGVAAVRPIRDEIRRRVSLLLHDLGIEPARGDAPTA